MATTNVTITADWTKIADVADDPVCCSCITNCGWEVAATAADSEPTVDGTRLLGNADGPNPMAVSRTTHPSGYLWARIINGPDSAVVAVDK